MLSADSLPWTVYIHTYIYAAYLAYAQLRPRGLAALAAFPLVADSSYLLVADRVISGHAIRMHVVQCAYTYGHSY